LDKARRFELDHARDRYDIDLIDGRHMSVGFHLFTAAELTRLFARHFSIDTICGLDIFHTRFALDSRWNPAGIEIDPQLGSVLAQLESVAQRIRLPSIERPISCSLAATVKRQMTSSGSNDRNRHTKICDVASV
jgi:hypothetical protein